VNVLSGVRTPAKREDQKKRRLSPDERRKGEARLLLALLMQVAFPGAAQLYYGDERAMEGFKDPFNRRTYPWHQEEPALTDLFRAILNLRHEHEVLRTGEVEVRTADTNVLEIRRYLNAPTVEDSDWTDAFGRPAGGEKSLTFLFNRSEHESKPLDLLGGESLPGMTGVLVSDADLKYFST
jgi:4-alpha-glucanotransferase